MLSFCLLKECKRLNINPNKRSAHILVFDSGLGGTTILVELKKQLPDCSYSYAMDNAVFPYGSQSDAFLLQRCLPLFAKLIAHDKPDIVVIACNTASTLFLKLLREQYPNLPFIGVVPAIKPAALATKTGVIALLATPATIQRHYIDLLSDQYANACQLIRFSHPDLALLAEQKMRGQAPLQERFDSIFADFKQHPKAALIDTFILGCTHYPAIAEELAKAWARDVQWLDSTAAIAKRAKNLLDEMTSDATARQTHLLLTSAKEQQLIQQSVANFQFKSCEVVEI